MARRGLPAAARGAADLGSFGLGSLARDHDDHAPGTNACNPVSRHHLISGLPTGGTRGRPRTRLASRPEEVGLWQDSERTCAGA
jgi:hypothetical protein